MCTRRSIAAFERRASGTVNCSSKRTSFGSRRHNATRVVRSRTEQPKEITDEDVRGVLRKPVVDRRQNLQFDVEQMLAGESPVRAAHRRVDSHEFVQRFEQTDGIDGTFLNDTERLVAVQRRRQTYTDLCGQPETADGEQIFVCETLVFDAFEGTSNLLRVVIARPAELRQRANQISAKRRCRQRTDTAWAGDERDLLNSSTALKKT
jgi:hypothetical protein